MTKNPTKFDNLRFRPFLIVEMWYKPERGVRTERKGWWNSKDNVRSDEVPSVVDRIDDKILYQANVIIDIMNSVVLKNTMNVPANEFEVRTVTYKKKEAEGRLKRKKNTYQPSKEHDDQVLKHFTTKYADMIEQAKRRMDTKVTAIVSEV